MKPRFSILMLLGITAFVGVSIAAFLQPLSIWIQVAFYAAAIVMLGVLVVACGRTSGQSVFCRGMICSVMMFTVFRMWEPVTPSISRTRLWDRPFTYYTGDSVVVSIPPSREWLDTANNHARLAMQSVQFVFGILGGSLALWRYRVLERRTNAPP